ncbi:ATP-binding protein [Pseudonocardia sp. NPDC049635]|uniref:sensor histidine kinase n=1 Tax=Pseudonocardia sp. NPDC049635 TaxID=3155506 RepID=UPI0033C6E4E6
MGTLGRLRERTGVRAASALAAAAAVAVVLVVAGISLVLLLDQTLKNNTRSALEATADQLANRIEANFSATGDAKRNAIDATGKRTDVVQVVTAYSDETNAPDWMVGSNGAQQDVQVIGSSDPLDGQPKIVDWLLAPDEKRYETDVPIEVRIGSDTAGGDQVEVQEMMVVGIGARAQGRPITVYAAQELGAVHQAVETVGWLVLGGVPILVLVTGYFTYLFAGRALRPVEEMRTRVAGMGDKDLSQRVPEPVARDEVGRLARTMNQMLGRIESSQTTQRRFVADASHELRSPLATVSTGLELLGAGMAKDSADRATVETLRGETARLTGLVEGLLFLARADERGIAPRREEVDLDEIAEAERIRPSADTAVAVRVTTEPVRVVGDRGQLVRIVRNLVDNAKRHAATTVAVSVRSVDGVAVIDVDDDGNGVPEADRSRVFERFVRLDEARSRGDGGSGLGLSIVSELVAAHGGTVAALDAPELGGARFRVTVPAVADAGSADPEGADAEGPDAGSRDAGDADAGGPGAGSPDTGGAGAGSPGAGDAVPGSTGPGRADPWSTGPLPVVPGRYADPRPVPGPQPLVGGPSDRRRPASNGAPAAYGAGPVPIRPDTVGSPYDENATRPIPVYRGGPAAGAGAAGEPGRSRPSPDARTPTPHRPPAPRRARDRIR